MHKERWASVWHQIDEVMRLQPRSVLEVGIGSGVFKAAATTFGLKVETLDLDPELSPDYVGSVVKMPFADNAFDVICAFQVLEHLPFEESMMGLREMARTANKAIVISLPDALRQWPLSVYVPKIGSVGFAITKPRLRAPIHKFDGEHYWEINKRGYRWSDIKKQILMVTKGHLVRSFRVPEYPYHRFIILDISSNV